MTLSVFSVEKNKRKRKLFDRIKAENRNIINSVFGFKYSFKYSLNRIMGECCTTLTNKQNCLIATSLSKCKQTIKM